MKTAKISQYVNEILTAVPYIKALGGEHLYMRYKVPGVPEWHPINHGAIEALIPFLEHQGLTGSAIPWSDACLYTHDLDMDMRCYNEWLRSTCDIYTINAWYYGVYPDMTKEFFYVEPVEQKDYIAITQTARYLNKVIDYRALNDYSCDKIFIGTESEYNYLHELYYGIANIEYVPIADFYEASKLIKASKLFISNQTSFAVIAEGIAHNRILCVCKDRPNYIMKTPNGRPVLTQRFFEQAIADMTAT